MTELKTFLGLINYYHINLKKCSRFLETLQSYDQSHIYWRNFQCNGKLHFLCRFCIPTERFPLQTLLGVWPGLVTQPRYKATSNLGVEIRMIILSDLQRVGEAVYSEVAQSWRWDTQAADQIIITKAAITIIILIKIKIIIKTLTKSYLSVPQKHWNWNWVLSKKKPVEE